ncbi:hypothetical protein Bhyg_07464, partial [Pseudolycoriella hygida]
LQLSEQLRTWITFADIHKPQYSWTSLEEGSVITSEWVNPCGAIEEEVDEIRIRPRDPKLLNNLRDAFPNYILRLEAKEMKAIDTSDISEWFARNDTYTFLHQIGASEAINLQKRHWQTQKYVGAFQHLHFKRRKYDTLHNDDERVTIEIQLLLALAKNLLCEIETTIRRTRQRIKVVFSRERMDKILTFRNNNSVNKYSGEVDELDNKFAKTRRAQKQISRIYLVI